MNSTPAPPLTTPAAAPPRVAAWIAAAPDGPVPILHASADTVHLDLGGRAVAVSAAGAPGLPHALRTNLDTVFPAGSSAAAPTAYLDSGLLHWGGRALVTGRLVDVRAPRLDSARMPKTSPAVGQGTPRSRDAGLVAVPPRITPEDATELLGRGDGLTPYGDDVLCGWLAAHRAAGFETPDVDAAVRRGLHRTTTLSATLLECALAGEVADLAGAYLAALDTGAPRTARAALSQLGHSSGQGLAVGIDIAVAELATRAAA